MPANRVLTGALAIVKSNGQAIGKMRNVTINEQFNRVRVPAGLGSIFDDEAALIKFQGTITADQVEIDYTRSGIPNGMKRAFGSNIASQIAAGNNRVNFEDEAVLDFDGISVDIYKKLTDFIDANGNRVPKAVPYAVVNRMFIESDNVTINEQNIAGRNQTFAYLDPVTTDL